MELVRERAAEAMGKRKEDITDMEVERFNLAGARDAALDVAKACSAARQADASAECGGVVEAFRSTRNENKSSDPKTDEAESRTIKQAVMKDMNKDAMTVCLEEPSQEIVKMCLDRLLQDADKVGDVLFEDLPPQRQQAMKRRAQKDAAVEVVGDRFQACMETAVDDAAKAACEGELVTKVAVAGLVETVKDVAGHSAVKITLFTSVTAPAMEVPHDLRADYCQHILRNPQLLACGGQAIPA